VPTISFNGLAASSLKTSTHNPAHIFIAPAPISARPNARLKNQRFQWRQRARLPNVPLRKKQEKKRLANLKRTPDEHESVNTAKRYKLPERGSEIIKQAAKIPDSRAAIKSTTDCRGSHLAGAGKELQRVSATTIMPAVTRSS
jgi:hypothetical protein